MTENIDQQLIIKDIDLALYKYGLIDQNFNNNINTCIEVKTNRFQKYKKYFYKVWPFIDITRYIIYLDCYRNKFLFNIKHKIYLNIK